MNTIDKFVNLLSELPIIVRFSHECPNILHGRWYLLDKDNHSVEKALPFFTIQLDTPVLKDMASGNYRLWREYCHDFRGEISFGRFGISKKEGRNVSEYMANSAITMQIVTNVV